jgi:hypothetical protein
MFRRQLIRGQTLVLSSPTHAGTLRTSRFLSGGNPRNGDGDSKSNSSSNSSSSSQVSESDSLRENAIKRKATPNYGYVKRFQNKDPYHTPGKPPKLSDFKGFNNVRDPNSSDPGIVIMEPELVKEFSVDRSTLGVQVKPIPNEDEAIQAKGLEGLNPLEKIIYAAIEAEGPMSLSEFMQLSLMHPKFGFYNKDDHVFGKRGDFVTSPEISQMFGEVRLLYIF